MNTCDTCKVTCCFSPIKKGPNSWTQQVIDWIVSEKGSYVNGNIDTFLKEMKDSILENLEPTDFFYGTVNSERKLQAYGVEVDIDIEQNRLLFLYRVLFICPEYNTETRKCLNYSDRPDICREFVCDKISDTGAPYEQLLRLKTIQENNFFLTIDAVLDYLRLEIEKYRKESWK